MNSTFYQFMRNIKNISHFFKRKHPEFKFGYHNHALIGKLSASILHDILTPITSLSIGVSTEHTGSVSESIIDSSTRQIREFVDLMKNFLKEHNEDEVIHINKEICRSIKLMTHKAISNGVQIQFIEFDQVWSRAHTLHIYQVVINLISNAIDASHNSTHKKIIVILKKDRDSFVIECKDFGCGIPQDNLKKICTPSFTTKSSGWGFGLYSTQFVVTQYLYGTLDIQSEEGSGSLFSCKLPVRK